MSDGQLTFLDRYFQETKEYPDPVALMMEPGVLHEYISLTFLNGWINYVKIAAAFLVTRYRRHQINVADAAGLHADKSFHHTEFGKQLQDDVMILAQVAHRPDEWWYFYADRDVSDCEIGRFHTDDAPAMVLSLFATYADSCSAEEGECASEEDPAYGPPLAGPVAAIRIDPGCFRGWISL